MLKTLLFGISLVFAQQLITIDSEEFTHAVHERILERRDFYVDGTEQMVHEKLIEIETSMLKDHLSVYNISAEDHQINNFCNEVEEAREEQERFYAEHYEKLADELVPEVEEEAMNFIRDREGVDMDREYMEGHLKGAAYVYDRAAYKIYREMLETAEAAH